MHHIHQFSRFAQSYQNHKIIQSRVAKYLVSKAPYKGRYILDLGAGSGEVFRSIDWEIERFYAVDASERMLAIHPKCSQRIVCDFDDLICLDRLRRLKVDQIFAASSLQWSRDLDLLLQRLSGWGADVAFGIFTSGTFRTIHRLAGLDSPIYPKEEIVRALNRHFSVKYEIKEYKLFFSDKMQMFRYIKRSGVSQGVRRLGYKETKRLIERYPYPYLEFEVVFAWTRR